MQANPLIAMLAGTQGTGGNAARPGGLAALLQATTADQRAAFAPIMAQLLNPGGAAVAPGMEVGAVPQPLQEKLAAQLAWLISDAASAPTVTLPGAQEEAQTIGAEPPLQAGQQALMGGMGEQLPVAAQPGQPEGTDGAQAAEDDLSAAVAAQEADAPGLPIAIQNAMLKVGGGMVPQAATASGATAATGQTIASGRKPQEQLPASQAQVQPAPAEEGLELPDLEPEVAEPVRRTGQPVEEARVGKPVTTLVDKDMLPAGLASLADRSGFSLRQAPAMAMLHQKPVFAQSPMDQVRLQLGPAVERGQRDITIQMRPGDLGRVDVKLQAQQDGTTQVTVRADRPETLDMLQRDVRHLERTLQDGGVKTDSIQFQLRGGGDSFAGSQQHQNQQHQQQSQHGGAMAANADGGQGGQPQDGPYASPYLPAQELAADLAEIPASLLHSGLMASLSATYQPHYEMRLNIHA